MKGTVYDRRIKEIYIADYDGANPRRITVNRSLNINPVWSSDGKAIAYTSYRRQNFPDIFIQRIYDRTPPSRRRTAPIASTTSCRRGRRTAPGSRS